MVSSGASGNFGGIPFRGRICCGSAVATGLNFVGNNVTATAPSGIANGVAIPFDTQI